MIQEEKQSMLLSLSLVLNFVMNEPAAENSPTSADVEGIVFKASPSFIIFDDRFSVEPNNWNYCFTILLKLELLLVEQRWTFVFEWITFSNFSYNVKDFSSEVSVLSSSDIKELNIESSSPLKTPCHNYFNLLNQRVL
ncbi:hypothetical protein AVEN_237386-1 [Araneus ventricosus]|uniref:Uncharacterized protein n=1 Tax=Araneus ventricosus TaxID=182803 RepID=A0A4Y2JXY9_ARAVE|nr:hypothetical protein AVEN_237386-1 [Araneus ventricosus]